MSGQAARDEGRLWQQLAALPPAAGGTFESLPLSGLEDAFLSRGAGGEPVVLLGTSGPATAPAMRLRQVGVDHDVPATLAGDAAGPARQRRLSVIRCLAEGEELQRLFVTCLGNALPPAVAGRRCGDVNLAVSRLVDLFAAAARPGRPPVGLWAELLMIARSRDPRRLLVAWHARGEDRHDFAAADERLEVKSTVQARRQHDFSLEQLDPPAGVAVTVASLLVEPRTQGTTIGELRSACLDAAGVDAELRAKVDRLCVEYLGDAWAEGMGEAFDEAATLASLRLYNAADVPRVDAPPPPGVSAVRFRSDLEQAAPLSHEQVAARPMASAVAQERRS